MTTKPVPLHRVLKYERLQQLSVHYPSLDPDATEAFVALKGVGGEVAAVMKQDLARHRLSEGRFLVLGSLLEHHPKPLSHSELAVLTAATKGNITGLVDGLERDGYVKREDSDTDRRVVLISLTPVGQQLFENILPDHFALLDAAMAGLSASECRELVALLMKLQAGLSALKRE